MPLEMAERAAELIQICQRIAEIGNKNVLSDIATAGSLAVAAGSGASCMVRTNTQLLKDRTRADELEARLRQALEMIATGNARVITSVGERV